MPRLIYFVACEKVLSDRFTGRTTVVNVFHEVRPRQYPCRLGYLACMSTWQVTSQEWGEDFQVLLEMLRPGETKPAVFAANFCPPSNSNIQAVNQGLRSLMIKQPGELRLVLKLNGESTADYVILFQPADKNRDDSAIVSYPAPKAP